MPRLLDFRIFLMSVSWLRKILFCLMVFSRVTWTLHQCLHSYNQYQIVLPRGRRNPINLLWHCTTAFHLLGLKSLQRLPRPSGLRHRVLRREFDDSVEQIASKFLVEQLAKQEASRRRRRAQLSPNCRTLEPRRPLGSWEHLTTHEDRLVQVVEMVQNNDVA
jgi:hypothetical protein